MMFRPLDWLLLMIAVATVLAGLLLNGPICYPAIGPVGYTPSSHQCALRFPIEIASGVTLAVIALLIVAIRVRRRPS